MPTPRPKTAPAEPTNDTGLPENIWQALAAPFPADEVELLPKQIRKQDPDRFACEGTGRANRASKDGIACGGYHALSVHLHYVGHAGITTRLNEVVGPDGWTWEHAYTDPTPLQSRMLETAVATGNVDLVRLVQEQVKTDGLPRYSDGGMWIKLTVNGVTKLGFGDAQGKTGPNAIKEIIGDALRNASMRFGVGAYLWSKSSKANALKEQNGGDEDDTPQQPQQRPLPQKADVDQAIADALKEPTPAAARAALGVVWNRYGGDVLARLLPAGPNDGTYADRINEHARRLQALIAQETEPNGTSPDAPVDAPAATPDAQPDAPAPDAQQHTDAPPAAAPAASTGRAAWMEELATHARALDTTIDAYVVPLLANSPGDVTSIDQIGDAILTQFVAVKRKPIVGALRMKGQQSAADVLDRLPSKDPGSYAVLFPAADRATANA